MEPVHVPSQACFCNDNQQKSGSVTKMVGLWIEEPTFTHGQLYVDASEVGDPQQHHFVVNKSVRKTKNVVYEEIL